MAKRVEAHVRYDDLKSADGKVARELTGDVAIGLSEHVTVTPIIKQTAKSAAGGIGTDEGTRTDVGAVDDPRLGRSHVSLRSGANHGARSGIRRTMTASVLAAEVPLSEKIGISGEVSEGSSGFGAKAGVDYHPTADDHYYVGYKLDPDRTTEDTLTGQDLGVIVAGARHRFNESFSAFAEDNYDVFGARRSLTQTYGVTYTPTAIWEFGSAVEVRRRD